jgi:hypothetical protein
VRSEKKVDLSAELISFLDNKTPARFWSISEKVLLRTKKGKKIKSEAYSNRFTLFTQLLTHASSQSHATCAGFSAH